LFVGLTAAAVGGCDDLRDPSTPCGALELGDADPGAVVSRRRAPVLAMAGGTEKAFVLHFVCDKPDAPEEDCTLTRTLLRSESGEVVEGQNAVLITSAGEYVVATDRNNGSIRTYRIDERGVIQPPDENGLNGSVLQRLVTSLRNSNWVIGVDSENRLLRYRPGESSADRIARGLPAGLEERLTVAAVGEQHLIGRIYHGNDDQSLYLIPIDEALDHLSHPPTLLMRGRPASRIVVSPRDEHVSITVGEGDNAKTLVFRVPDGSLLDRFDGALVSGREALTETVGMRAVSPDGSHLAYRTAAGSVALRDVEHNSACLVRSASTSGKTALAGFSAEGKLYFESDLGPGKTSISVWDASTRYLAVLSTADDGAHLAAVPSRTPEDAMAWAIGVRSGDYMALADSERPSYLDVDGAVFIPRDDPAMWVLASEDSDSGGSDVRMRRLTALTAGSEADDDALRFGELEGMSHDDEHGRPTQIVNTLLGPQSACMSTGTPGAKAYTCGSGSDTNAFAAATSPTGEDPVRPPRDAEVPDVESNTCRFGADPFTGDACDGFDVDNCCYQSLADACIVECGSVDHCETYTGTSVKTVVCGTGSGLPG